MDRKTKQRIAAAAAWFPRHGGQGVLVPGGLILTAAHVIGWSAAGEMALSFGEFSEEVVFGRRKLRATILAVEPVADIAVLGCPDNQYDPEGAEAFEDAIAAIEPVAICSDEFELGKGIRVHIRTHTRRWIEGNATQFRPGAHTLSVHADKQVEGGTSGGPVVTEEGLLLGVVSSASIGPRACVMTMPRPHIAAPVWLSRVMTGN